MRTGIIDIGIAERLKALRVREKQEKMLLRARKEHKNIETECGILCPICAEMSDMTYEWLAIVTGGDCYNCNGKRR